MQVWLFVFFMYVSQTKETGELVLEQSLTFTILIIFQTV